jgi:uncharacterized protein (DUF302 family)
MQSPHANEYGDVRTTNLNFDEALVQLEGSLKEEGFGILCQIDIQAKLKEKLAVDCLRYVILGACNPLLAHQALQRDINIGLLLPCNAVVYEQRGQVHVGTVNPINLLAVAGDPELEELARQVNEKLQRVLDRVAPRTVR